MVITYFTVCGASCISVVGIYFFTVKIISINLGLYNTFPQTPFLINIITGVSSKTQLVFAALVCYSKVAVLSISRVFVEVLEIHSKFAFSFCQAVNFVQSEPKLAIQISEPFFVVVPAAVEINRAIQSLLEHCPPPTGCCLVTVHVKGTSTVWVDLVNSTCSFSSFVQFSAVLISWKT